ncbi:MAG: protein kinase, partial [Candidatus Lindowbacteria bacterium]|nr:protein kinase [Candidatus Lindowbacteria bacterium]
MNDEPRQTRKIVFHGTKKHMKLGLSSFKKGEYKRAIEQFELILLHDKHYVRAYNNLGYSYRTIGEYDKALAVWEEGLRIDPSYKRLQKNISSLQKRVKSAEQKTGPLPMGIEDLEAEVDWISENAELVELREGCFFDAYLVEDGGRKYILKTPNKLFANRPELLEAFQKACSGWLSLAPCDYVVKASSMEHVLRKPFLALEHADGGSLRQRLDEVLRDIGYAKGAAHAAPGMRGFTLAQILEFAIQASVGLHFIHERLGVAHGDVQPENFLLQAAGADIENAKIGAETDRYSLKVTDVGVWEVFARSELYCDAKGQPLSQFSSAGLVRTQSGFLTPSISSCAPELLESVCTPDILTDVYSFGVSLYEMFTGTVPFSGSRPAEVLDEMNDRPEHPSVVNPRIPPALANIAMRCLERRPVARYENFLEIVDELIQWLDGNRTALLRLQEQCRRYRKI